MQESGNAEFSFRAIHDPDERQARTTQWAVGHCKRCVTEGVVDNLVTIQDPGGVSPRLTGMAYRDHDIVRVQEINVPCGEELRLIDSGDAVACRTALKDMIDLGVDVILGKAEGLEQDISFIATGITGPGLCSFPGQRRKCQE